MSNNNISCCSECPYGKDDFERRMSFYNKTISEEGIPNDIYHYLKPEDAKTEFEQFIWCDKVGGKVYCFGHCEDAFVKMRKEEKSYSKKKSSKRRRMIVHKRHLKKLAENTNQNYPAAYYPDKNSSRVKRLYRGKYSGYLKKQSNKKIRKYKTGISTGGCYKKMYDIWDKIY